MSDKPPKDGRAILYAMTLPKLIEAARACGYALGIHGSLASDLDLIAAPWIEEASAPEELVAAMAAIVGGTVLFVPPNWPANKRIEGLWKFATKDAKMLKPHGRVSWTISYAGNVYIDLAIMPRACDWRKRK